MFTGKKFPLTLVFGVLVTLAMGVSCKGFFPDATLSSIAVSPTNPQVNVGQTETLQAWGTYSDNTRSQITSGVSWTSGTTTIATITGTGNATLKGVAPGSSTITASAQGLSGTATAVVIGDVTSITVNPASGSVKKGGTGEAFAFAGSPGPPAFITTDNGGTLTITPSDSNFTCVVGVDGSNNPAEVCSANSNAGPSYQIQMTYPNPSGGNTTSPAVTVTVS